MTARDPLGVLTWKWSTPSGPAFGADYVNVLLEALRRHLHVPFRLFCVTDDPAGLDPAIEAVPLTDLRDSPRCRRRMRQFDRAFAAPFGSRVLCLDLDVVIVRDITPLVVRSEPVVCWHVPYADVFSGSCLLMTPGALQGLWDAYAADPDGYPVAAWPRGVGSDQAMLNYYVRTTRTPVGRWGPADGLVTYFGAGYERFEHLGVGPRQRRLPLGARIVVLGSADKAVLDEGQTDWARTHWCALRPAVPVAARRA